MMRTILLLMLGGALCNAQVRLQMPMQGAPLPQTKFELVNKIPAIKLTHLPKEMPVFRYWLTKLFLPERMLRACSQLRIVMTVLS
jgi:hypothetical protein